MRLISITLTSLLTVNGMNLDPLSQLTSDTDVKSNFPMDSPFLDSKLGEDIDFNPLIKSLLELTQLDEKPSKASEEMEASAGSDQPAKPESSAIENTPSWTNSDQPIKPASPDMEELSSLTSPDQTILPISPFTEEDVVSSSTNSDQFKEVPDEKLKQLIQMSEAMEQKTPLASPPSFKEEKLTNETMEKEPIVPNQSAPKQIDSIDEDMMDESDDVVLNKNFSTNSEVVKNITSFQFKLGEGASDQIDLFHFALIQEKLLYNLKRTIFGRMKDSNKQESNLLRRHMKSNEPIVLTEEDTSDTSEFYEECFEEDETEILDSSPDSFNSPRFQQNIHQRGFQHNEVYIRILSQIIQAIGGNPADTCHFDFRGKHMPDLKLLHRFILTASVSAYGGVLELVSAPAARQIVASILAVRSQEMAYYNLDAGGDVFVEPFADIISVKQALSYYKRFIRNCQLSFQQGTHRTLIISPSSVRPKTRINLAVPRRSANIERSGESSLMEEGTSDNMLESLEGSDAIEDLTRAGGYRLYCAFVFDTYQVNTRVTRRNSCMVPRNSIPGIHKVYLTRNNQIMITADRGPEIFAGPAYINIDKGLGQAPPHPPPQGSNGIIGNFPIPPPSQDDEDNESGDADGDEDSVGSDDSSSKMHHHLFVRSMFLN